MVNYSLRLVKRFAVLVPGLVIVYFSARDIFPVIKSRVPLALAILLTYGLTAYVLIPAAIRVIRIFIRTNHLPLYSVTPDGFASDPLNIGLIGTRRQLIRAMEDAGWEVAEPHTLSNQLREAMSTIFRWPYPNAPVSSLYLFGRKQDIAFEIQINNTKGQRHHVRFWATTFDEDSDKLEVHNIHWQARKERLATGNLLWVGAASLDTGFSFVRHNIQLTHMIDPDTNKERDLIVSGLVAKGAEQLDSLKLTDEYRLINRAWRGSLHSDGIMHIVRLPALTK